MAPIVMGELICFCSLAISFYVLLNKSDVSLSNKKLKLCTILALVWITVDIHSWISGEIVFPAFIALSINWLAYISSSFVLISFMKYCEAYINERKKISAWLYRIPIIVICVNVIYISIYFFQGKIVTLVDGKAVVVGGLPALSSIVYILVLAYVPIVALINRKYIGERAVVFLGLFGIAPIITSLFSIFIDTDYSVISGALSLIIVIMILQRRDAEIRLTDANRHLIQANEEQEGQIEEIIALNTQLQENQLLLESRYSIIKAMSSIYFVSYYIDLVNDSYVELSAKNNIKEIIKTSGKAQESLYLACEKLVQPEYQEQMREFWTLSTVNERLKEKNAVSCRYVGMTTGWSEAYLIVGDRDENGDLKNIFFSARTIHDEKALEEEQTKKIEEAILSAENANKAKSTFLFNMSHDIRTPMNAIIGFTELMKNNIDDKEKLLNYLDKIQISSGFLLSLINNVLELSRIESGKATLDESVSETGKVTNEIEAIFSERMKKKNITFTKEVDCRTKYIYTDIIKTKEIILNLVSNAYKYTPEGGSVSITVKEIPCEREGYTIFETKVSDTGIGMSKEFLPHLFEEFTREKTSTEDKIEGTGLGMPIVKRFVDLMNGTIEVESELGKGTSFTIRLPHRICKEENVLAERNISELKTRFDGKRILLAEDNDFNAEIAQDLLNEMGIEVERAEDGIKCVDMLQKAADSYYDLILMDIQMPHMDGYKASQIIRRMQEEWKKEIPIIAMTANAFDEDKKNAIQAGMNAHLTKPINIGKLQEELTRWLPGK